MESSHPVCAVGWVSPRPPQRRGPKCHRPARGEEVGWWDARQAPEINKPQAHPPCLVKGEGVCTPFPGSCPKWISLLEQDSAGEAGWAPCFTWLSEGGITPLISKPRISHRTKKNQKNPPWRLPALCTLEASGQNYAVGGCWGCWWVLAGAGGAGRCWGCWVGARVGHSASPKPVGSGW